MIRLKLAFILLYLFPIFSSSLEPVSFIRNKKGSPTLVNSLSFHPKKNWFCLTFTHHDLVPIYEIKKNGQIRVIQTLKNPQAELSSPQNAIFSPDGKYLLIVNWSTRYFNFYSMKPNGHFSSHPDHVMACHFPEREEGYRPHGVSFSPKGNYLGVIYGSFVDAPSAIVLYRIEGLKTAEAKLVPLSVLNQSDQRQGIPKGITFSPDGSSLIVSFIETNALKIFSIDWEEEKIHPFPKEELSGPLSQIDRAEDLAFSPKGNYLAVTNSSKHSISFYRFCKLSNPSSETVCLTTSS